MYMLKRQMCVVWIKDQKIFNADRAATSSTRKYGEDVKNKFWKIWRKRLVFAPDLLNAVAGHHDGGKGTGDGGR
jgi:hypothetical protein